MDLSKEVMRRAYIPFWRLATYNCFIYTVSIALLNLLMFILINIVEAEGKYPWDIVIFIYFLLCMKAFRIPLTSLIEQKACCFEKVLVKIDMIETDGLFGNYKNSNQEIKNCYPKDVQAERDKLICIDENGKKLKVRMIGSEKKVKKIQKMFLLNEKNVYITFGKLTRIIFVFESVEPCDSISYNNVKMLNKIF